MNWKWNILTIDDFDAYGEYSREYKRKHRKEIQREKDREYRYIKRDKVRKREREYVKKRRDNNESIRLLMNLRNRTNQALKGNLKANSMTDLCGCTPEFLREYLKHPEDGGKYHIDHIRPCHTFDMSNPLHQQVCFHYSNLQVLSADENLEKGSTWNPSRWGGLGLYYAQMYALSTGNLDYLPNYCVTLSPRT